MDDGNCILTGTDDLQARILKYQVVSNTKLKTDKCKLRTGYRVYRCVSHIECPFYASFGPRRGNKQLILKNCCLHHEGFDRMGKYPDGHKLKEPISTLLTPAVANVKKVKYGKPVANDVTKASRNLDGHKPTTKQAHKI